MTVEPAPAPTGLRAWVAGARPRTLPNSVVPVLVGTGCAAAGSHVAWSRAVLALVVSLALQIGVNYANDYSDGVRGSDADRIGPLRLTASGVFAPRVVLAGACIAFGVACAAGLVLAASTSWWLVLVGAAAVAAAWFYTGGSRPYGYHALGDVGVFVFFGLVAVIGTAYVAADTPGVGWLAVLAAVPVGLLSVSVLIVNNLRDIPRDAAAGKRTLAVVLGDRATRRLYVGALAAAALVTVGVATMHPPAAIALLAGVLAIPPVRHVLRGDTGRDLFPTLGATGRMQLGYGVLLTVGLFI
ncbi:MAG: 1,4-dihydroxy-2-naphthoate polyprenyltransferase [Mycobacteriales bacterium]